MLKKNSERANGRLTTVCTGARDRKMGAIQTSAGLLYAGYFTRASLSLPHATPGVFLCLIFFFPEEGGVIILRVFCRSCYPKHEVRIE